VIPCLTLRFAPNIDPHPKNQQETSFMQENEGKTRSPFFLLGKEGLASRIVFKTATLDSTAHIHTHSNRYTAANVLNLLFSNFFH
jgi:hypothetical protein